MSWTSFSSFLGYDTRDSTSILPVSVAVPFVFFHAKHSHHHPQRHVGKNGSSSLRSFPKARRLDDPSTHWLKIAQTCSLEVIISSGDLPQFCIPPHYQKISGFSQNSHSKKKTVVRCDEKQGLSTFINLPCWKFNNPQVSRIWKIGIPSNRPSDPQL